MLGEMYECPKCKTTYTAKEAIASGERCPRCGVLLNRYLDTSPPPAPVIVRGGKNLLLQVIPPRDNQTEALAVENILSTLTVAPSPFSLEIAGLDTGRAFLIRGKESMVTHIAAEIQAAYGQAECIPLDGKDPAEIAPEEIVAQGILQLRRGDLFPLRTYSEFKDCDPMLPVLGAFSGFKEGERALAQIVLSPAPDDWADNLQYAREQSWVAKQSSPQAWTHSLFATLLMCGGFLLAGLFPFLLLNHQWGALVLLIALGVPAAILLWKARRHTASGLHAPPEVVQRKVSKPAFRARIQLTAVGQTKERAQNLLGRMAGAFRLFNLAEGNGFQLQKANFATKHLYIPSKTFWGIQGHKNAPILNVTELAGLWHPPVGDQAQLLQQGLYKRLLPLPTEVQPCPGSVHIGFSTYQGKTVPVHLSPQALQSNILLCGKTQTGKSVLMQHLAAPVLADKSRALVVIDPHSDLVKSLLGLVPKDRLDDVIYIDLSDETRSVGLNIFDARLRVGRDKIVADLIRMGQQIWSDYWGPRMESALRFAALTLAEANQNLGRTPRLAAIDQFTILDLPFILTFKPFRDEILDKYIDDPQITTWWRRYFDPLYSRFQQEIINPVQTKIHHFAAAHAVRNVVSQPFSTINLRDALSQKKIILMNTASGDVGIDTGGFLGAVVLNYLETAIREQIAKPREERTEVLVLVDEFQSLPGVDYAGLLGELQKMGASFVLATQALAQLDAQSRTLRPSVLANIKTIFVFQTSGEDARYLTWELDRKVAPEDIINLDQYKCYLKTVKGKKRLPALLVDTLHPSKEIPGRAAEVVARQARYTKAASEIQTNLNRHMEEHYHLSKLGVQGLKKSIAAMAEQLAKQKPEELTSSKLPAATGKKRGERRPNTETRKND